MTDKRVCRWCEERVWVADECRRCARARVTLSELLAGLPWLAAFRLATNALKALRSTRHKDAASDDPGYLDRGWKKRHAERAELSEYFTAIMENAQK